MAGKTYIETFDRGPGGWIGWDASGAQPLEIAAGCAISRSPWWVDSNHAPPGGGYLHLLFCLHTHARWLDSAPLRAAGGLNRFIEGGFPTDFTDARLTLRLRGELEQRGAELVLLAQAEVGEVYLNHVLTGQPFQVGSAWSEQTVRLTPDPGQWKCLGSRHDRLETYGWGPVSDVLRQLDGDLILVLHPLEVAPAGPFEGDPHRLRAEQDYAVDRARLPEGWVMLDEVRIEFP